MDVQFHHFPLIMSLLACVATSSLSAAQQAPPPATSGTTAGVVTRRGSLHLRGLPFSADEVIVRTQTLAGGTNITSRSLVKLYRDSEGRTRSETYRSQAETGEPGDTLVSVFIFDPVTGIDYHLDPRNHTARKDELGRHTPPPIGPTTSAPTNRPPAPQRPDTEDLGTQVIEGLNVKGIRTTRTIPVGAEGNDQPIEITEESWTSPELHVAIMKISKDPRHGQTVTRLTHLVRDEPPAELFQVPTDYTVLELQPVAKPVSAHE